ncbi:MAG: hypothetical protein AB1352_01070 [Patescibacteria group bacterium]
MMNTIVVYCTTWVRCLSAHRLLLPISFSLFLFLPITVHAQSSYSLVQVDYWTGHVISGQTLTKEGNPWYAPTGLYLDQGATLTLEPGVVLKVGPPFLNFGFYVKSNIIVNGIFTVHGTAEEPVIITSWADDSDGTDVTGDGSSSSPAPGDWGRIQLTTSGENCFIQLQHLIVRYTDVALDHLQYDPATCTYDINYLTVTDSAYGVRASLPLSLRGSRFDRVGVAINHWFTTQPVDARDSWWGDPSGPSVASNPRGTGAAIFDGPVLYDPWVGKDTIPISDLEPVIVIPGIIGSWEQLPYQQIYPNLSWNGLVLDPWLGTYDNLVTELINTYGTSKVFAFPYNWRQDNTITAHQLKERIEFVKTATGYSKVDIVAHSMGGLVSRQYIESDEYGGDVDQLITIWTPHKGAPKAYSWWEGFEGYDGFADQLLKLKIIFEAREHGYLDSLDYIHQQVISISQLLPIYSYLIDNGSAELRIYPSNYPTNPFLELLNTPTNLSRLYQRIQMCTVTSDDFFTLARLKVGDPEQSRWEHGKVEEKIYNDGDETITIESALAPPVDPTLPPLATTDLPAAHRQLVTDGIPSVNKTLTGREYQPSGVLRETVSRMLFIFIYSPATLLVTDSEGRQVGYDPFTHTTLVNIPYSAATGPEAHPQIVGIPNPEDNEYTITLMGTGNGGEVTLEAVLLDEALTSPDPLTDPTPPTATTTLTLAPGETKEFKVQLNEITSEEPIILLPADTEPPSITFTSPLPDAVYEHYETLTLSSTLTDESPPLYATTSVDTTIQGTFTSPSSPLITHNTLELPTLHLGTHTFTMEGEDFLGNTTSTSTTFSLIATPTSILKMLSTASPTAGSPPPKSWLPSAPSLRDSLPSSITLPLLPRS